MKRSFFSVVFLVFVLTGVSALSGRISYLEGSVEIRDGAGNRETAAMERTLVVGDTVLTGDDGFVELDLGGGSVITVESSTVFTLGEVVESQSGQKRGFFRVVLGAVGFRFRKWTEPFEPEIHTPVTICGVRGTDFTVYAAPEGSALYIVADGLVEVTARGETSQLSRGQGVEVRSGEGPGDVFPVKTGYIDYSTFRDETLTRFAQDPERTVGALAEDLETLVDEIRRYETEIATNRAKVDEAREKYRQLIDNGETTKEQSDQFYVEDVAPFEIRASGLNKTYRHYVYSAVVLRRYLIGSLYVEMRTRFLADARNPLWVLFQKSYRQFLSFYEENVAIRIIDADI